MPSLADAIRRQYEQLGAGDGQPAPNASPRFQIPDRPTIPQNLLDALQGGPITLPQGDAQGASDMPVRAERVPGMPPDDRDSLTSSQPFTRPAAPITTPISAATERIKAAVPKMDPGFAGLLGTGAAILEEAGGAWNSRYSPTQGGEMTYSALVGALPGAAIPQKFAELKNPEYKQFSQTALRDMPVIREPVRALEGIGGALNADWKVVSEPAISTMAMIRERNRATSEKINFGPANALRTVTDWTTGWLNRGNANPTLFTEAGMSKEEANKLLDGFVYGTNNAEQSRKFEEMLRKISPREQEANPISSAVIGQLFAPSTYIDMFGWIPKVSALQEMRRVYGAAGDVTNAGKVLREGGNPLENLLYRAFQPGNIKEGEVLSEKAAQIVRPPDTTTMARAFRAFKKTPIAQTTDNVARAIGNIGPYLTDAGRTLGDKLKWLDAMKDVATTKVKTPELLQWEKSFGVKNAPDYHTLLHAIGKFDSKPVVDGYRRANEILDSLGQTIGTRRGPVFNADLATYAVEQAKGSPYAPVFDQVVEAWKRGDLDVTQAKMALERVAGVQLTADLTDHLAANLAQMAGIQKPNFVTNFVNRMKNLEGALYVGGNPGSLVNNVLNDMFTQLRHGAAPQTEKQLDEFFARLGAPYVDNLGQKVRGSVDATRGVTDNLEGARSAYGTTLPNWLANVPGVKQMNEAFQRNQAWGRKVANATGAQRFIAQNHKVTLPPTLKGHFGAEAGRIENQLKHALNINEAIAILKDGKMNWARFVDEFADEINQLLRPIAAREMGITPDMMHDALSPLFTENLNRALNDALEASARGEDVVAAFRKARGKYWGGDDLFGPAPTTVSPPPSTPPGGGGAATTDAFWNKVPANKLNYMQEQQRVFLENNKRAPSVAELEAMLAGKNPAPEVPLTQPKQAQAPSAKPTTGSVPFQITRDMRQQLYDLKYTKAEVDAMKPQQAQEILQAGKSNAGNVTGGTVTLDVPDSPAVGVQPDSAGAGIVAGTQATKGGTINDSNINVRSGNDLQGSPSGRPDGGGIVQDATPGNTSAVETSATSANPIRTTQDVVNEVKARAAKITTPQIKRDLIREWAALFHEGAPENEMRAISRSIEKWGDDVLLEKAKSYIDRARASGQTWPTMWADMAEDRAHYLLEQIAAGNPKYADTAYWTERVANGDALTRLLRGGENGFDWTKLERPYEYRPYESFAQYRKRVTDAAIERDFINRPAGDTGVSTASAGAQPEPVAPTSVDVGTANRGNDVGDVGDRTSSESIRTNSPLGDAGGRSNVRTESEMSVSNVSAQAEDTGGPVGGYSIKHTGLPVGGWYVIDNTTGETVRFGKKIGEMPKRFQTPEQADKAAQKWFAKNRNASDAQLRGIDPNEMHSGGDFRQRFNDAAEEMKQAGPTAATDPAANRKAMHALEQALLDRVEEELGKGVNTAGKLPPQVEAEMMRYLKDEFMPNLNGVKAGANAAGRFFQDATVLNYDGAWNIESALLLERPFVHWWLHSALNYGRDFLDHPAMLAFMLRLANNLHAESNRLVDEGKMPKRFRNTFKVSMPFEIPGMGDTLWINPLRTVFPFEDVMMLNAQERAGYQTVKEDGTVDPSSVINDTFGIHTPYKLAYNALTQDSEEFWHSVASIPALKLLRAGTGIGIPSKFDASYYERAIKELVADGTLTQEQANVALLQQSGKDWDTVKQRANLENYTMREGSALFGMRGQVFTPGEQKYYDSKRAKEQAYQDAVRKLGGNPNMDPDQRNKFLKDRGYYSTPEYQQLKAQYPETDTLANIAYDDQGNHMPLDKAQEARAREYYLDKIGEAYWNAPELKQKLIAEDLGDEFKTLFRNKDTRNLDAVPMSMVLGWANALDRLLQEPVAGANLPNPDPYKLTFTTDAQNKAYQTMYDEVQNSYGWEQYGAGWDKYNQLKAQNKDAAKAFLNSSEGKKLLAVSDTIDEFFKANPDVQKIMERAGLRKTQAETTTTDPKGAALNQAVTAAGLNWDTINAKKAEYNKLPKGTGARSGYLAKNPDLLRYFQISGAIYNTDEELSQNNGGGSKSNEPYFRYHPKDTYSKTYGGPKGRGGTLTIDFQMLSEANKRFGGQQKKPYQGNMTYRIGQGGY